MFEPVPLPKLRDHVVNNKPDDYYTSLHQDVASRTNSLLHPERRNNVKQQRSEKQNATATTTRASWRNISKKGEINTQVVERADEFNMTTGSAGGGQPEMFRNREEDQSLDIEDEEGEKVYHHLPVATTTKTDEKFFRRPATTNTYSLSPEQQEEHIFRPILEREKKALPFQEQTPRSTMAFVQGKLDEIIQNPNQLQTKDLQALLSDVENILVEEKNEKEEGSHGQYEIKNKKNRKNYPSPRKLGDRGSSYYYDDPSHEEKLGYPRRQGNPRRSPIQAQHQRVTSPMGYIHATQKPSPSPKKKRNLDHRHVVEEPNNASRGTPKYEKKGTSRYEKRQEEEDDGHYGLQQHDGRNMIEEEEQPPGPQLFPPQPNPKMLLNSSPQKQKSFNKNNAPPRNTGYHRGQQGDYTAEQIQQMWAEYYQSLTPEQMQQVYAQYYASLSPEQLQQLYYYNNPQQQYYGGANGYPYPTGQNRYPTAAGYHPFQQQQSNYNHHYPECGPGGEEGEEDGRQFLHAPDTSSGFEAIPRSRAAQLALDSARRMAEVSKQVQRRQHSRERILAEMDAVALSPLYKRKPAIPSRKNNHVHNTKREGEEGGSSLPSRSRTPPVTAVRGNKNNNNTNHGGSRSNTPTYSNKNPNPNQQPPLHYNPKEFKQEPILTQYSHSHHRSALMSRQTPSTGAKHFYQTHDHPHSSFYNYSSSHEQQGTDYETQQPFADGENLKQPHPRLDRYHAAQRQKSSLSQQINNNNTTLLVDDAKRGQQQQKLKKLPQQQWADELAALDGSHRVGMGRQKDALGTQTERELLKQRPPWVS